MGCEGKPWKCYTDACGEIASLRRQLEVAKAQVDRLNQELLEKDKDLKKAWEWSRLDEKR